MVPVELRVAAIMRLNALVDQGLVERLGRHLSRHIHRIPPRMVARLVVLTLIQETTVKARTARCGFYGKVTLAQREHGPQPTQRIAKMADNDLYIRIYDGHCWNHPIYESNLKMTHPEHDFAEGSPEGYVRFTRVPPPIIDLATERYDNTKGVENCDAFEHNGCCYEEQEDGSYSDVWYLRKLTDAEKVLQDEWQALLDKSLEEPLTKQELNRFTTLWEMLRPDR